jgi:hypothetical protein
MEPPSLIKESTRLTRFVLIRNEKGKTEKRVEVFNVEGLTHVMLVEIR